jgi:hypothetical protein
VKRPALLVWVFLAACASGNHTCDLASIAVPETFAEVLHGDALAGDLRNALLALATCPLEEACFSRAGLDRPSDVDTSRTQARACLDVLKWTKETDALVAIYLSRHGAEDRGGEFLMIATYDGQGWRFSWPATLGPSSADADRRFPLQASPLRFGQRRVSVSTRSRPRDFAR